MQLNSPFHIKNFGQFEKIALETFYFQAEHCIPYKNFIKFLGISTHQIKAIHDIPFLPIQFFKSHKILSSNHAFQQRFLSSGTTGVQSQHLVTDISLYEQSFRLGFQESYGQIQDYIIVALLPSYLEREGSSLIYMVRDLIEKSNNTKSGFFLKNTQELLKIIENHSKKDKKLLILGVSYALLDLVEHRQFDLQNAIVMETGGMKGRRKELVREALHQELMTGFNVPAIHSEYGMTELLSQAYSKGNGLFECPPWMHVFIRDTEDALTNLPIGRTGGINVVDLANRNSCSFIATQDLGKKHANGSFEVLGRFDYSDIRGCNLLIQ